MKKFLLTLAALLVACNAYAATATSALDTITDDAAGYAKGRTNVLLTQGFVLTSLTIVNNTATNSYLTLFDTSTTNQTYSIGAYTNFSVYATNWVKVYTNMNGVEITTTNAGLYTLATAVGASTGYYPKLAQLSIPASTTLTYTPESPVYFSRGLLFTNTHDSDITVTYSNIR